MEPEAVDDDGRMASSDEPAVATDAAGAIRDGIDPLRAEQEEVLDAATGSAGTKPIAEPVAAAAC